MRKLTMLGTGNAMVTKCYNTCFYVTLDDGALFLTDAGGGNGILRQLELTGFDYQKCHHMFVTHGHTDHVLGVIWVMRKVADLMNKGKYEGEFHIYCHDVVREMLLTMTKMTLKKKDFARVGTSIFLHELKDGSVVNFEGVQLTAFEEPLDGQGGQRARREARRQEPRALPHGGQEHRDPQAGVHGRGEGILPRQCLRAG